MPNFEKVVARITPKVGIAILLYFRIENLNLEKNNLGNQAAILLL